MRKCPYCDFASEVHHPPPTEAYCTALRQEITSWRSRLSTDERPLISIYFGGGTPSLLSAPQIQQILQHIKNLFPLTKNCEITLEANPESVNEAFLSGCLTGGVNRLSLGVQAFSASRLAFLNRPHTLNRARTTLHLIRQAGFDRFSLDLIYATPNQTRKSWQLELEEAVSYGASHLSCYQLTIAEETPFYQHMQNKQWGLPKEKASLALFQFTHQYLKKHGYEAYEISNFAKPGQASRHNLNYWSFGDYLGIGCAAHGKITQPEGSIWRTCNTESVQLYLDLLQKNLSPLTHHALLPPQEAASELLIMGVRHKQGLQRAHYLQLSGEDLVQAKSEKMNELRKKNLLTWNKTYIRVTKKGIALTDSILLTIL
ncbi:MAG: radical SAM family heme chaperone HemW [Magnetococcus sp. DMHC-6]